MADFALPAAPDETRYANCDGCLVQMFEELTFRAMDRAMRRHDVMLEQQGQADRIVPLPIA